MWKPSITITEARTRRWGSGFPPITFLGIRQRETELKKVETLPYLRQERLLLTYCITNFKVRNFGLTEVKQSKWRDTVTLPHECESRYFILIVIMEEFHHMTP